MRFGFGRHESALNPETVHRSMKILYIVQHFYVSAVAMVKIALLLTYAQIFTGTLPVFRRCLYIVGTAIVLLWCSSMFVTIFQCRPIHFFWDREPGGSCINARSIFIGMSIPNITLDLAVLSVPIPSIWKLQLPRMQKAGLTLLFGVGIL